MSDIKEYKVYKKAQVIVEEIDTIDDILDVTLHSLKRFHHYIPIAEILSLLKTNQTLLKIYQQKQKDIIDNYQKKE